MLVGPIPNTSQGEFPEQATTNVNIRRPRRWQSQDEEATEHRSMRQTWMTAFEQRSFGSFVDWLRELELPDAENYTPCLEHVARVSQPVLAVKGRRLRAFGTSVPPLGRTRKRRGRSASVTSPSGPGRATGLIIRMSNECGKGGVISLVSRQIDKVQWPSTALEEVARTAVSPSQNSTQMMHGNSDVLLQGRARPCSCSQALCP